MQAALVVHWPFVPKEYTSRRYGSYLLLKERDNRSVKPGIHINGRSLAKNAERLDGSIAAGNCSKAE